MYALELRPDALRALRERLPPPVVSAVTELLDQSLRSRPHAVGKPLRPPFEGWYVTRRGEYRVIYAFDDERRRVDVIRIAHRRDAYRRL